MSLFTNASAQALRGAAKSFATNHQMRKEDSAKLAADVEAKISSLSKGMDLSPAELRQLATIVLNTQERLATGKHTQADTDEWTRKALADLRTRHMSNARVKEVIHATNALLKEKHPAIYDTLKKEAALGSHPFIVRHLTDRYLQHERQNERTANASKWPAKARADQMAGAVSPGGLLAGANVAATALKVLAKFPLGTDPNAA